MPISGVQIFIFENIIMFGNISVLVTFHNDFRNIRPGNEYTFFGGNIVFSDEYDLVIASTCPNFFNV